MNTNTLVCPLEYQKRPIRILQVGAGGNGAAFTNSIYRLHTYLTEMGHDFGIELLVADGSTVSETNTLRQNFWAADVGYNKASLVVNRFNLFGRKTQWDSIERHLTASEIAKLMADDYDILVTCVDSAKLRAQISDEAKKLRTTSKALWLDLGNERDTGNVFFGHVFSTQVRDAVPNVVDLNPEIRDVVDNPKRSCSAAESFNAQGVLVNAMCANIAAKMLNQFVTKGSLDYHAVYFDFSKNFETTVMPINPDIWASYFGYSKAA
ncbi:PRTRC system ThiF family protein [Vibrio penaeicida]|uniref:PRTRC system ThiF family protein n=1 Tax=Vibrio penaeicida TaxID=104609 RepID=UPI001CC47E52|nr:PRTRC system ThiF family protein [Vibrio penaeicida]